MLYSQPAGLTPSGQDSGSASVMQMLMSLYGQGKTSAGMGGALPPAGTGGNLSEYANGFSAGVPDASVYSGYNTSIYGNLGAPKTDNGY